MIDSTSKGQNKSRDQANECRISDFVPATALSYVRGGGASHAQVSRQRRLSSGVIVWLGSFHNIVNRNQGACFNTHYLCSVELALYVCATIQEAVQFTQ
jgi:hypothetical protein